jgi:hypothetical protein
MAFADPLVVTIGGAAKNLPRIDSNRMASEYYLAEATQSFRAYVRSQELKKEADGRMKARHNISLKQTVFATSTTPELVRLSSFVLEHYVGDDPAVFDDVGIAVAAMITAANVVKLNNYES